MQQAAFEHIEKSDAWNPIWRLWALVEALTRSPTLISPHDKLLFKNKGRSKTKR
jgi:hypothetical protein